MRIGDEALLAPMGLFVSDLLGLQGPKLTHVQKRSDGDPDDPLDEFFLRQTTSREVNIFIKETYQFESFI